MRRKVTMNWDDLDDFNAAADDDEFYESTNRLSVVVPLDMPLPGFDEEDDQEFNDSRVSFSVSNSIKEPSLAQYDMWMVAPGSISDRRKRLLQGMGLNSKKDFARLASTSNSKLNKACTKRLLSTKPPVVTPPPIDTNKKPNDHDSLVKKESSPPLAQESRHESQSHVQNKAQPQPQPKPEPEPEPEPQPPVQVLVQDQAKAVQASSQPILLVRSRSDSDIETSSFNIKRRKEDMIGSISKQRLTRTSSELVTPSVGKYANVNLRLYTPNTNTNTKLPTTNNNKDQYANSSAQLDSFFLIKNLDTGKEFVVKEFSDEGMWNKVSDLQTGKQLTMDEFENSVGHSPVVKELMRRTSYKRNNSKLAMTNSYLSKSFRNSKKKGAAILKNLKGSMSISKTEKVKVETATATAPAPAPTSTADTSSTSSQTSAEQIAASNDKNSNSEWVKAKAYGKPLKEFSAMHLCQKIQAHDGSIWTMRFSSDGHYLASAGEDKVIHVWEVQECDVNSMRSGDDKSSTTPDNRPPLPDNSTTDKKKKSKNNKKKPEVPEYVKVPESMFGLSEKPVCTFNGHQDDVLDLSWSRSKVSIPSYT